MKKEIKSIVMKDLQSIAFAKSHGGKAICILKQLALAISRNESKPHLAV